LLPNGILDELSTFTTDPTCKLQILGRDSDTLGVDGTQVGVLEKADEIGLSSLLNTKLSLRPVLQHSSSRHLSIF
jgi:hypothetical protein